MSRRVFFPLAILALIQLSLSILLSSPSLAKEWEIRKSRGTLRIVDLGFSDVSMNVLYSDFLIGLDKDSNFVPNLAEDWRWVNDRTIEFKLRKGVIFHNGEELNAEAVRVNWEAYKKMEHPTFFRFMDIPDDTVFEIIDKYKVRFTFPEPNSLAYFKILAFDLFAPAFFSQHTFKEFNWSRPEEPGPWGAGPFKLVEGSGLYGKPGDRVVLEAFEDYWDPRYPKVKRVIFESRFLGDRKEAMRLCRETEGEVDMVSFIRPLDTLKVAMSKFAKVVKSKDVTLLVGWFNQRKKGSKWRDVRLRKALNYAINRKELWKYAAKGNAYNLEGFLIPAGAYGHNPSLTPWTYDTTKARKLLTEAGYPNGFEVKIIAPEGQRVATQIIRRMLERIGLKASFDILTTPQLTKKTYIPLLDRPPEEQDWDLRIFRNVDWFGHSGLSFLTFGFVDMSNQRWIERDPVYEKMWNDMIKTVDDERQEKQIRQMVQYLYDRAHALFIYSPLSLYAVNKEVNFVPFKNGWLNLKETSVTDNHWSVREEKK
jgi:peptide/nickel transport system substrate-binding protein